MRSRLPISDLTRAIALLVAVALLAACSGRTVHRRPRTQADTGNQGSSWDVVLGGTPGDWELARLDGSMNIRAETEPAPSLDDLVQIYMTPRPERVWYYRTGGSWSGRRY